jgi:hypothetical protein
VVGKGWKSCARVCDCRLLLIGQLFPIGLAIVVEIVPADQRTDVVQRRDLIKYGFPAFLSSQ